MEYNHLQEISIMALRNRLLLLHHISELFCPCIPMFDLEGRLGQTGHGPSVGFDTLRGILISQGKVRRRRVTKIAQQLCLLKFNIICLLNTQSFTVLLEQEAAFRKVVQATMVRDRQHGPVVELNRIQVRQKCMHLDICFTIFFFVSSPLSLSGRVCSRQAPELYM